MYNIGHSDLGYERYFFLRQLSSIQWTTITSGQHHTCTFITYNII